MTALLAAACTNGDDVGSDEGSTDLSFPTTTSTTTTTTTTLPPTTTSTALVTTTTEPQPPAIEWKPCGNVECGTFDVPLDHDDPTGATVELSLVRVTATDPTNRIGSLFVNFGGPGAGATVRVSGGFRLPPESSRRFDLIGWDPRGVGSSDPVACATEFLSFLALDQGPDDEAEQLALDEAAAGIAAECAEEEGDRLAHLSTDDVVRDLDLLRQAVGDDQLNYLGLSYGTLIGLRYAELFPDRTRALTLDGMIDPQDDLVTWLSGQAVAFEAAIQRMLDACPDQEVCGPDAYDTLAADVETLPLVTDDGPVGPSELAQAALTSVYLRSRWPVFHEALSVGYTRGSGIVLREVVSSYLTFDFASYLAVECVDLPRPIDEVAWAEFADEMAILAPRIGSVVANELLPCVFWPESPQPDAKPLGPTTAPILVVGTTGDPATPYEDAVAIAERYPTAHLLTRDGEGHTALVVSRCVQDTIDLFMTELELPSADLVC
ncbi:MAG: alpha/beta hydrolase [Actinomycetia bacterium]|nr:alpha/beta hydrolase [Actinomycetes bacterium]